MAAVNPFKSLRDEATCSICLSYFKDPVSLDCGHNFCRACISQCWEGSDADTSCPQCRETFAQRTLRPNRPLANFVEIAKQLSFQAAGKEDLCKEHQEGFKLFCNQDQILICVICRESQAHRAHTVVPIEEAAQVYKEKIQTQLNTLKKEREELLEWKQTGEKQCQEYLEKIKSERQKIVSEFEQLRLFLEEQERLLLARLEELEKEIVELQVENVTKLSEEISCLSDLISEIEEKCHQSTSEFLQDIKSTWSRCEKVKVQKPVAVPQDLRKELSISSQRNVCLQEALKKFKETLPYQLRFLISKAEKEVQTTLDQPNPCFVISTDNSAVKHQNLQQQNKFYPAPCVLGYKGFTSGRCHWEVE
ncbi:zinc finger protein RFP-like isoform X3 [Emydura macquarii macquarii]